MSSAPRSLTETIVLGSKSLNDYLLQVVVSFNRGVDVVEILGKGRNINKAVNLYNRVMERLGDSVVLDHVEIGSLLERGRRVSYIRIRLKRR